jgi:hypothetical protein
VRVTTDGPRQCTRKQETREEFRVVAMDDTGIQGCCGLSWCGWQTTRSASVEDRFAVSRTGETGVLLLCSVDQRENISLTRRKTKQVYFLAILLGVVFLGVQLHCCADLNSGTTDSHLCPICCTAGTAIATPSLIMAMAPAINRLVVLNVMPTVSVVVFRSVAPRAPPAS